MTIYQQQCLLAYLGYAPGPIDGCDGPQTRAARAAFAAAEGEAAADTLLAAVAAGRFAGGGPSGASSGFWAEVPHFRRAEFACKCGKCGGYPAEPQEAMVRLAEAARTHFGHPASVVSGLRCPAHNAAVGGVPNSRHLAGKACDLTIQSTPWQSLLTWLQSQPTVRYAYHIENSNNVHFDVN